jgi:DNA-binding protein H-NS
MGSSPTGATRPPELEARNNRLIPVLDRERVIAQMREFAGSVGMSLEDLLRQERGRERARVPATSVRFRHPENSALTWAGRGKRPQWIIEWLASGRTLEDLSGG